jgi:hypothetical protein
MPGTFTGYALALVIAIMLLAASCVSAPAKGDGYSAGIGAGAWANAGRLAGLIPIPPRRTNALQYPASAFGKEYLPAAGMANISINATAAVFSPNWVDAHQSGLGDAAYCVYGLGLDSALTDAKLTLVWAGGAPAAGQGWLGLSDIAKQRWQWRPLDASEFTLSAAAQYADADGNLYAAIVLLGSQERTLNSIALPAGSGLSYPIVDTAQAACFDAADVITPPAAGEPFYGQDSQYLGNSPSYTLSGDGLTVHDNVTGLTWMQSPDTDGDGKILVADKMNWTEAQAYPATLNSAAFGGFDDWRLPTIKELYSLIDFRGTDPSGMSGTDTSGLTPFIDRTYFVFDYGDTTAGERVIDSQYASSTMYVNKSWQGYDMLFGVNFADGRIKGYDLVMPGGLQKTFTVLCVRGRADYGFNTFVDNGDGTITDKATGLMWQQADSGEGVIWQDALSYAEGLVLAQHDDWRLPNAKELQSILDYSRSPDSSGSPALEPVFSSTQITNEGSEADYPCYWTGTTHTGWSGSPIPLGGSAIYVAFGRAMGYMQSAWHDVHGAGAQRSDPKDGDPADFPHGRGPQGDAIRIFNYVRCVRDVN